MKKIYFVRHGESEGNIGPIRQTSETSLTALGRTQSETLAARLKKLPIEVMFSSTMTRAKETAAIIQKKLQKPLEYSELFSERRRPSLVLGKYKNDPAVSAIEREIRKKFSEPGFRHSDEENLDDLKKRALAALKFLEQRPEQEILVVTHGFFMRVVLATVIFGQPTNQACERVIQTFYMENTALTIFCYDPKEPRPWWVWIWNDHAHL